jgi:hypothetical protein
MRSFVKFASKKSTPNEIWQNSFPSFLLKYFKIQNQVKYNIFLY